MHFSDFDVRVCFTISLNYDVISRRVPAKERQGRPISREGVQEQCVNHLTYFENDISNIYIYI